jgi:hypothetical protein
MPTITFDLDANTTSSPGFSGWGQETGSDTPASVDEVLFLPARWLPREQEYYWTEGWQAGEQETLRELAQGGGVRFDSTQDLVRWLLGPDEA